MPRFPIVSRRGTPGRIALVGVLLAGALVVGCRTEAAAPAAAFSSTLTPGVEFQQWLGDCDPDFAGSTQQVLHAVRLVYPAADVFWPPQPLAMAFHIGNDEWVTTAWEDFTVPIALYRHDPTARDWRPDLDSRRTATLIGRDAFTGVALLQADGRGVPALRLGATAPSVGDRLRRVSYRYWLDSRPRGHVWWPARCIALPSEAPPGPGDATLAPDLVVAEQPLERQYISLQVLEGTVQEHLTVDGRHYLHHDMWERTRERDCCPGFNVDPPSGAPLFTPDGAVVGLDGHGIWRAEPVGNDRADVIAYDVAAPTLPAVVALIRANGGTVGDGGGGQQALEAFCPRAWWNAVREVWRDNWHPGLCGGHALTGIRALEAENRWSFWFSGPGRRDLVLYRLTDSQGRDTRPEAITQWSVAEDPQRHLQRLPPGTYGMEVLVGFAGEDPIWSNRVWFRLLPRDELSSRETLDAVFADWPAAVSADAPVSPQAWWEAADRAGAATFGVWLDPYDSGWYEATPFMAVYLGNDEWIVAGRAAADAHWALASRRVSTDQEYTLSGSAFGEGFRPATVIGTDEATGLSLLRATGVDVPALSLAAERPALCAPLLLAGYWEHGPRDIFGVEPSRAPRFAADCTPAVIPGVYWPVRDAYVREEIRLIGEGFEIPAAPGQPETALAGIFAHAGLPYLLLHPPVPDLPWPADIRVQGGPVITATGEVAGIHTQVQTALGWNFDVAGEIGREEAVVRNDGRWALAAPAIDAALARIRAAAIHTLEVEGTTPTQVTIGEAVRLDVQARDRAGQRVAVSADTAWIDWSVDPSPPPPPFATALSRALRPVLEPVPGMPTSVYYTPVRAGPVTVRAVAGACTALLRGDVPVVAAEDGPCAVAFPFTVTAPVVADRLDSTGRPFAGIAALEERLGACAAPEADYVHSLADHLLWFHQEVVALAALQEEPVPSAAAIRGQIIRVAEQVEAALGLHPPRSLWRAWNMTAHALYSLAGANYDFLEVLEREAPLATAAEQRYYFEGLRRFQAAFPQVGQLLRDYCAEAD